MVKWFYTRSPSSMVDGNFRHSLYIKHYQVLTKILDHANEIELVDHLNQAAKIYGNMKI